MTASYAWIVTKDYTEDLGDTPEPNGRWVVPAKSKEVLVCGPRNADSAAIERLKAGEGQPFQLWDDDRILYYTGRWFEQLPFDGFEGDPLDDYGEPNAGCTMMTVDDHKPYI